MYVPVEQLSDKNLRVALRLSFCFACRELVFSLTPCIVSVTYRCSRIPILTRDSPSSFECAIIITTYFTFWTITSFVFYSLPIWVLLLLPWSRGNLWQVRYGSGSIVKYVNTAALFLAGGGFNKNHTVQTILCMLFTTFTRIAIVKSSLTVLLRIDVCRYHLHYF